MRGIQKTMKILSIGDLHGKDIWNTINAKDYDRVIFVGDIYDEFYHIKTSEEVHDNALSLVQWAKEQGNVDICIGNHDAHYFKWQEPVFRIVRGAGFTESQLYKAYHIYIENKELFKVAYQVNNYLWTHAGLSQAGYGFHFKEMTDTLIATQDGVNNLADALNKMWDINYEPLFYAPLSRGGDDTYGGPLWASKSDTIGGPLSNYHQIVGHTETQDIIHKELNPDTSITYIDCLNSQIDKFYEINI